MRKRVKSRLEKLAEQIEVSFLIDGEQGLTTAVNHFTDLYFEIHPENAFSKHALRSYLLHYMYGYIQRHHATYLEHSEQVL